MAVRNWSPRLTVARFTAATVVSIGVIAGGVTYFTHETAQTQAIIDARNVTLANGANLVAPALSDGLLTHDPQSIAIVDETVRQHILQGAVVHVRIWAPDGTILYADEPSLIGKQFALGSEETEALSGKPAAEVSNLTKPENQTERQYKKLLEVYDGIKTPSGRPVLFEAYLRYDSIDKNTSRILTAVAPALIGGLIILLAVQIPFALGMSRRLARGQAERETLLRRNIETSESERRRIAADLHDGVVQSLVGSSYSVSAVANRVGETEVATELNKVSADLRQSVRELRTMIVTIAPPRLHEQGLYAAIHDLTSPLERTGVRVTLDIKPPTMTPDVETLTYRFAQEAVRNIIRHAQASEITLTVTTADINRIRCTVADNGVGFDPTAQPLPRDGDHIGLRLLRELVDDANGTLDVQSEENVGTTMTLELPTK